MRRHLIVLPLAALALSAGCAASSGTTKTAAPTSTVIASSASPAAASSPAPVRTTEPPKATTTNLPLGTAVTVTSTGSDGQNVVTVTAGPDKTSKVAVSQYGSKPKGTYVGLLITYDCTTGSCEYNPFDFTLRSADGTENDQAFEGFTPDLHSGNLTVGVKAKGYITYDLVPGTYSLEYGASAFDADPASWTFTV